MLADYDGGRDLVPITIWNGHEQSVLEMARFLNEKIKNAKAAKDADHNKATALFTVIPTYLMGPLTAIGSYLGQNCGWSVKALGVKGNSWGHAVITNIGTLGIEQGFAPISPPLHC